MLEYIANLSKNKQDQFQYLAVIVFIVMYIIVRVIESYVVPYIPSFISREFSVFLSWGPVIASVIFGLSYMKKK